LADQNHVRAIAAPEDFLETAAGFGCAATAWLARSFG
jgi:hypothetical protein